MLWYSYGMRAFIRYLRTPRVTPHQSVSYTSTSFAMSISRSLFSKVVVCAASVPRSVGGRFALNEGANRLGFRIGWLFENHPPTTDEHAGKRENCGHKSKQRPSGLGKPAESAEMQSREPEQAFVGETVSRIEKK